MLDPAPYLAQAQPHYRAGRFEQAAGVLRRGLEKDPASTPLLQGLSHLLMKLARHEQAIFLLERATAIRPADPQLFMLLGEVCREAKKPQASTRAYARSYALAPHVARTGLEYASALLREGRSEEGYAVDAEVYRRHPDDAAVIAQYAADHDARGLLDETIATLRRGVAIHPDNAWLRQQLLLPLMRAPAIEPREIFLHHAALGAMLERMMPRDPRPHANTRDPARPLLVGYVSQDFRNRSVGHFIEPIFERHDPAAFRLAAYHNTLEEDELTARLKTRCAIWRDIATTDDPGVADQIRADGVDILVDLSGHTGMGRLGPFCSKPAPVQFTYLGYANTTGLSTIDYRLVDLCTDPPGAEAFATETLLRLEGCFLCYAPPPHAGEPAPPPSRARGHVTFGSFNTLTKVGRPVVELWSRLLHAVPGSRLLLKAKALDSPAAIAQYHAWFAEHAIDPTRLDLRPETKSKGDHLAAYRDMDIALDTFPYNGTTTTMEALWMGVPVVALAGHSHVSRVGVSLLTNVGHPEWIAQNPADYLAIASSLAGDLPRLESLRTSLRPQLAASTLCDAAAFTRRLEKVYREAWARWCASTP
jgi:Flp pilus assembly protein TadD